jgi:hypothetical protein
MQFVSTSLIRTGTIESHPSKMHPSKARPEQDLSRIRSQWDAVDLQRPCCESSMDQGTSVLRNLNDGPNQGKEILPPPKSFFKRSRHARALSTKVGMGSNHRLGSETLDTRMDIIFCQPVQGPRSSYNRELGRSGLDHSEKDLDAKKACIDRSAEFDEFLQAL